MGHPPRIQKNIAYLILSFLSSNTIFYLNASIIFFFNINIKIYRYILNKFEFIK